MRINLRGVDHTTRRSVRRQNLEEEARGSCTEEAQTRELGGVRALAEEVAVDKEGREWCVSML